VVDNPDLLSGTVDLSNLALKARMGSFLNYRLKQLELSFSVKAISPASVRLQANLMFSEGYPLQWWETVREVYATESTTRREHEFFAIVDGEYTRIKARLNSSASQESQITPKSN
jgi:hypothetical protein